MQRKETSAFRGNVDLHLTRLRELDRQASEAAVDTVPMARSIPTSHPAATPILEYDRTRTRVRWRLIGYAIVVAINETLGITLLCALFAFFLGFLFPEFDYLVLPILLSCSVLVLGVLWALLIIRQELRRAGK